MLLQFLSLLVVARLVRSDVIPVLGKEGERVTLTCGLETATPPNIVWEDLAYNNGRDPEVIYTTGVGINTNHRNKDFYEIDNANPTELNINGLKDSDIGSYFCESTLSDGSTNRQEFSLGLTGNLECESDVETSDLVEGDTVVASCNVAFRSSVSPSFEWYLQDTTVDSQDSTEFGQLSIEARVTATKEMDKQKLLCKLSFHGFEQECGLDLNVKHAPYVTKFENTTGNEESQHSITCTVSANPAPSEVDILKVNDDGTRTPVDPTRVDITKAGSKITLTFKKLASSDAGQYYCEAKNDLGDGHQTASVEVEDKPEPETEKPDEGNDKGDEEDKGDEADKGAATGDNGNGSASSTLSSLLFITVTLLSFFL